MSGYKIPKKLLQEVGKNINITSIRFNDETWESLNNLCKENHLTKSEVIRIAIKNLIS